MTGTAGSTDFPVTAGAFQTANKAAANARDGYSPTRDLREVAEIPMVVALKWKEERGIDVFNRDHWPAVKKLLRDPEWRHLRTSPGRI